MKYYYRTKDDVNNATLEEKLDTMLYINAKHCLQSYEDRKQLLPKPNINNYKEKILNIGGLYKGIGHFHNTDESYMVIGFMVESEVEYYKKRSKMFGFRSIYFDKCSEYAPIDFDDADSLDDVSGRIDNGIGDHVNIIGELISKNEVQDFIKKNNIDLNKYLKETGMYLDKHQKKFSKNRDHGI